MIELDLSKNPSKNKVVLDGLDISRHVISVTVRASAYEMPLVELELLEDVRVTSDGRIIYELPHDLPDVTSVDERPT